MNHLMRSLAVVALVLVVSTFDAAPAPAQGINLNGLNIQTSKNKKQDNNQSTSKNDDDDQNANDNSNNQNSRRSKSNKNSDDDKGLNQFQQFFPGQGDQNQNSQNQFRRSGQQGNISNNQQFQNWQQTNQNSFKIGTWNGGKWQGSRDVKQWTQAFGGNQQPFSSQWYKDHPKAWKDNNNKVNFWVGGSLPGVYSWLGWGNVPQQYRVYYGNTQQPQYDRSYYGEWYPLGVYSLMSSPGDVGTRIVQLAVDQNGRIGGNYYDMITSSNYSISGDVRQQSQRVSWWLNKNQFVRFRANLYELVQPYGSVTVQLPGGEQQWQFVRLEN